MILPPRVSAFLGQHLPAALAVWPFEAFVVVMQFVVAMPALIDELLPTVMFTALPPLLATGLMLSLLAAAVTLATGMRIRSATLMSAGLWLGGFCSTAVVLVLITTYYTAGWLLSGGGLVIVIFIFSRAIYWGAVARALTR